jgi:hypothetical protein
MVSDAKILFDAWLPLESRHVTCLTGLRGFEHGLRIITPTEQRMHRETQKFPLHWG